MIERTFDAAFFNRICNLPEVRPGLGGEGYLDTLRNPCRRAKLRFADGARGIYTHAAWRWLLQRPYAVRGRGPGPARDSSNAERAGFHVHPDGLHANFQPLPRRNPATLALALKGGAKSWFRKEHDPRWDRERSLAGTSWIGRWNTPDLEADGKQFHDLSRPRRSTESSTLPVHDDEPAHDRMVGAVSRMCHRGQARKGVILYNLWASAAGYAPITLLADDPPLVDVVDGIVGLEDGKLRVLAVKSAH
jgi:hypothetical protein